MYPMYSPASKKRDGPHAHTHTDTPRTHRHAHPTHIILHRWDTFWVSRLDPHTTTTTACAHSRFRSTCCSRLDCNSTRGAAVCCVRSVCYVSCVRPVVCCTMQSTKALAYRCLVSSSLLLPPRGTWPRPCTWRFSSPKPRPRCLRPEVPVNNPPPFSSPSDSRVAAPVVAPRVTRAPRYRDTVRLWRDLGPT